MTRRRYASKRGIAPLLVVGILAAVAVALTMGAMLALGGVGLGLAANQPPPAEEDPPRVYVDYEYEDDGGTAFATSDDRTVRRRNADAHSWDAWAVGRSELGSGGRVTTVLNAFSREQGVSGIGVAPALAARSRMQRLLAGVSTRVPCAVSSLWHSLHLAVATISRLVAIPPPAGTKSCVALAFGSAVLFC